MTAPEVTDLDERLARYAAELDERMPRVDGRELTRGRPSPTSDDEAPMPLTPSGQGTRGSRVWLVAAAAMVLLVVGSLVWWRASPPSDQLDVSGDPPASSAPSTSASPSTSAEPTTSVDPDAAALPLTWEQTGLSTKLTSYADVTEFRGGLIAVGMDDVIMPVSARSADGMTWVVESRVGGPGRPVAVAADDELVVAVGFGTGVAVSWESEDGEEWTQRPIPGAQEIHSIARTANGFVTVGTSAEDPTGASVTGTVPAAWGFDDGAWDRIDLPDVGLGEALDIAVSPDSVLIVGTGNGRPVAIASFASGWLAVDVMGSAVSSVDEAGALRAVSWSGDRFVTAGTWDARPVVLESTDGLTFDDVPIDPLVAADATADPQDVAAIGDTIVVTTTGDGTRLLSDVPTWTRQDGMWTVTLTGATDVATWNGRFIALGLEVWRSSIVRE
jgi:hypothetical protein